MMLIVLLWLTAVVYGMFDITYPKGIKLDFTAQQFPCEYDPDAYFYPWNPRGPPLGLKLYIDKSLIEIWYCRGMHWQNYSSWAGCLKFQQYVQPLAGDVCIQNVTSVLYGYNDVGTYGTIRIRYQENGDGTSLQCIPIVISDLGPTWDGHNCDTDENTGFQPFYRDYYTLYGATYLNAFANEGLEESVTMEYVTYTVDNNNNNNKTSALYNYWLTSNGGSSLIDLKTVTPSSVPWGTPSYFITFTSDGTTILYNGAKTVYGWHGNSTDTANVTDTVIANVTATDTLSGYNKSANYSSESDSGSLTETVSSTSVSTSEGSGNSEIVTTSNTPVTSSDGSGNSETVTAASSASETDSGSSASALSSTALGTVVRLSGLMVFGLFAVWLL